MVNQLYPGPALCVTCAQRVVRSHLGSRLRVVRCHLDFRLRVVRVLLSLQADVAAVHVPV